MLGDLESCRHWDVKAGKEVSWYSFLVSSNHVHENEFSLATKSRALKVILVSRNTKNFTITGYPLTIDITIKVFSPKTIDEAPRKLKTKSHGNPSGIYSPLIWLNGKPNSAGR
jgi:hypothetical protein